MVKLLIFDSLLVVRVKQSNNSGFSVPPSLLSIYNTQRSTKTKGDLSLSLEEALYTWKGFAACSYFLWCCGLLHYHMRDLQSLRGFRLLLVISGLSSEDSKSMVSTILKLQYKKDSIVLQRTPSTLHTGA